VVWLHILLGPTELIKYANTPPNQLQRFLKDYINN